MKDLCVFVVWVGVCTYVCVCMYMYVLFVLSVYAGSFAKDSK